MKVKNILKNFKYINPFYWINKRKNKEIYFIVLAAKYYYVVQINQNNNIGLCHAFCAIYRKIGINVSCFAIKDYIPKFNRKFLNAKYQNGGWWWDTMDYRSRLSAFEKLLAYYKNKI